MGQSPRWVTLSEDESVVWQRRPALGPYVMTMVKGAGVAGIGLVVWLVAIGELVVGPSMPASAPGRLVGGLLLAVGLVTILGRFWAWLTVRYLITTEAVYSKTGLSARSVQSLSLDRIETPTVSQSGLGKPLSYGTIRLTTTDEPSETLVLRHVRKPDQALEAIPGD